MDGRDHGPDAGYSSRVEERRRRRERWRCPVRAHRWGPNARDPEARRRPRGVVETVGANLGFLERRVKGDLERFKEFIESRRMPTGAWRGEIHGDRITED